MFESLEQTKADPILGLTEAYQADPNPDKINLGVGVYKDETGETPILSAVKKAEERLVREENSKSYLAIQGQDDYGRVVQDLLFGSDHEVLTSGRAKTAHTPGGTGALRVAGDFIRSSLAGRKVWLSDPTWPNHPNVFRASGLELGTYPYFDASGNCLDFEAMSSGLRKVPAGDAVVLHVCCHNPTGVDPTPDQWREIAEIVFQRELLPILDFAYQGLGEGLTEDAAGLHAMIRPGCEMLVASSFSKNLGLYNERVGALTLIAGTSEEAGRAFGHVKSSIRANYSNPPYHGEGIVTTVLGNHPLRNEWERELATMRDRINKMRTLFVETLKAKGVDRDFSFIAGQRGMFSFSGLTKEQVQVLRDKYSIYIVGSGRINVAGMTASNMDRLCEAIAAVL